MVGAVLNKVEDLPGEDVAVMEEIILRKKWNEISQENRYFADNLSWYYGKIGRNVEKVNDPETAAKIFWFSRFSRKS